MVEDYEESLRNPKKLIRRKTKDKQAARKEVTSRKPTARGGIYAEATDRFVQITEPISGGLISPASYSLNKPSYISGQQLPPALLAPTTLDKLSVSQPTVWTQHPVKLVVPLGLVAQTPKQLLKESQQEQKSPQPQ